MLAALLLFTTLALIPGAPLGADPADAATIPPTSGFEIDGNLAKDGGTANVGDWLDLYGPGTTPGGDPTTGIYYHKENTDVCGVGDDIAPGGTKLADGPIWLTKAGKAVGKGDLKAVWVGAEKIDVSGQINDMLYLAFELCNAPNAEFQVALALEGPDGIPPFNPAETPTGSTDDLLIVFNFTPSTGTATALVHTFDGTQWNSSTTSIPGGSWEASILPGGSVGEVAINLTTAGLLPGDGCSSITVSDQVATINGNSLTSGVNDIVAVDPLEIDTCGTLKVEKVSDPDVPGAGPFTYFVLQTDGGNVSDSSLDISGVNSPIVPVPPAVSTILNAAINVGQTDTWLNVVSQTDYTINEFVIPDGWELDTISCTFTDIFAPGAPDVTRVIYANGAETGEVFTIPPFEFPGITTSECTVTNATSGVIVEKIGAGDPSTVFPFDINGEKLTAGGLPVDGLALSETSDTMPFTPGTTVTVTETLPSASPAWTHTSTTCLFDDGSPVTVTGGLNPTFDTVAGKVITCTFENNQAAKIIVEKQTLPDGSPQAFAFAGTELNSTGIHDGETIEAEVDPGGPYISTEVVLNGWDLTNISCDDPNSSGDVDAKTATFNVVAGQTVKCTFTNTETPTLQLVKEISDSGDQAVGSPSDWKLSAIAAVAPNDRDIVDATSGAAATDVYASVEYALSESGGNPNYTDGTTWSCTAGTVNAANNGVTLTAGQDSVCTIVNTLDLPTLQLVKEISDSGDQAVGSPSDWKLSAIAAVAPNDRDIVDATSGAAATDVYASVEYALSESGGNPNYTDGTTWSCTAGTVNAANNGVTLTAGQDSVCTIVNTLDLPTLQLVKEITTDNGGDANADEWTLTAISQGADDSRDITTPGGSGTADDVFAAVEYALAETTVPGYTNGTTWSCTAGTMNAANNGVTLTAGQDSVCTIVNDDVAPTLTLFKRVVNDHGGTAVPADWTLKAISDSTDGDFAVPASVVIGPLLGTTGAQDVFANNEYRLSETGTIGHTDDYTQDGQWSCVITNVAGDHEPAVVGDTITLTEGESAACVVNNDDDSAELTLVKHVVNDNGGTSVAADWTLKATSTSGFGDISALADRNPSMDNLTGDTGAHEVHANNVYTLSEMGTTDYTQVGMWSCVIDGADPVLSNTITLAHGATAACTAINDDDAPSLILVKDVVSNNGGTAVPSAWDLFIEQGTPGEKSVPGTTAGLEVTDQAGTYALSESVEPGYSMTSLTCDNNQGVEVTSVTIGLGETVTCTFTNDDDPASLLLQKTVVNDNGGNGVASDWTLSAGSNDVTGSATPVEATDQAGTYALSESVEPGYAQTSLTCSDDPGVEVTSVTIGLGDTVTCTFVNDDLPASIDIEKWTNGSDADDPTGPYIHVGDVVTWTYVVTNTGQADLEHILVEDSDRAVSVSCTGSTLAVGASMTCTATGIAVAGQYENTGHVFGTAVTGAPVSDSDPSHYFGSDPAIGVTKDVVPSVINVGEATPVTWTIVVSNTGNVALHDVAVTDALVADCDKTIGDLAVGGSSTYTCNSTHTPDNLAWTFTNVAVATGIGPAGTPVTANDDATILAIDVAGTAELGDTVWLDKNKNGVQDAGEPGINGAKVFLKDASGTIVETATTANNGSQDGFYKFVGLDAGTYTSQLDTSSVSGALTTAGAFTVDLADGEEYLDADFGVAEVLPVTGLESEGLTLLAIGLLLLGGLAVFSTRRRRVEKR